MSAAEERLAAAPDRINLALYLTGTASWFVSLGVQSVLFAWLVTIELHETPEKVGFAQFSMMLPTLCLILFGGAIADRVGGPRIAFVSQALAILPVAGLAIVVAAGSLNYEVLIAYALAMGVVQAFITPSRDGMLALVAGVRVQRTVVMTSLVQFGVQILGFSLAGLADLVGPFTVLAVQAVLIAVGATAYLLLARRLRPSEREAPAGGVFSSVLEGMRCVAASPAMRGVALLNVAVGMFFMGAYIVALPLFVREIHDGSSGQLALVSTSHMIGVVIVTLALLRLGDLRRPGRALLICIWLGALNLALLGSTTSFTMLMVMNAAWGATAGIVMSMSRTLMQEAAPADLRGRVMAFYSFSFLGVGPFGSLLSGWMVENLGVQWAMIVPAIAISICAALLLAFTPLWRIGSHGEDQSSSSAREGSSAHSVSRT